MTKLEINQEKVKAPTVEIFRHLINSCGKKGKRDKEMGDRGEEGRRGRQGGKRGGWEVERGVGKWFQFVFLCGSPVY